MKIGIYAAEPYPGGEVNYIKILVRALSLVHGLVLTLYASPESTQYFTDLTNSTFIKHARNFNLRFRKPSLMQKLRRKFSIFVIQISDILKLKINPYRIDDHEIDLFIFPYFAKEVTLTRVPYIIIPHDKRAFESNNYFKRKIFKNIFKKARLIIAESYMVKQDILKILPGEDRKVQVILSPPPVHDIQEGQTNTRNVIRKYKLPRKFVIYPSHIIPSKNHMNLILALKKIKVQYATNINLVCIYPSYNPSYFLTLKRTITNLGLINDIIFYENIPYADLIAMYRLSTALVVPTFFESVSMPIWEAFFLGVPVAASNVSSLPEQVGDAALLFEPNNIEDIATNVYKLCTNGHLRNELIHKGYERVKDLTLENYARQWQEIILEAFQFND